MLRRFMTQRAGGGGAAVTSSAAAGAWLSMMLVMLLLLCLYQPVQAVTPCGDCAFNVSNGVLNKTVGGDCGSACTNLNLMKLGISSIADGALTASDLTSLTSLNFGENQLTSIPTSISNLTSLRELFLNYNSLTSIPDGFFDQLTNLTFLNLGYNQLTSIPTSISGLTSLTGLFLNYNSLTSIPDGFFDQLTSLQHLDLSYNDIYCIDAAAFDSIPATAAIDIRNNNASLCVHASWPASIQYDTGLQNCSDNTSPCLTCSQAGDPLLCSCPAGFFPQLSLGLYTCQPCPPASFKSAPGTANCSACSTSPCNVGQYRLACNSTRDGECGECRNKMEGETVYVGSGYPYDRDFCPWDCKAGYMLRMDESCSAYCEMV